MDGKQEQLRGSQNSFALSAQTVTFKYPEDNHSESKKELLNYSVTNNSQINFQNGDESYLFTVPKPWSVNEYFVTNMRRMIFSEIVTIVGSYGIEPVIRKSFAIDDKRKIRYYVVGKEVKDHSLYQLPQMLTDAKLLLTVSTKFHLLRVCDGLEDAVIHLADADTVYVDSIKRIRSTECLLVAETNRCNSCTQLRKTFFLGDLAYTEQNNTESATPLNSDTENTFKMEVNEQQPQQTNVEVDDIPKDTNTFGNQCVDAEANPAVKEEPYCDEFHIEIKEEQCDTSDEAETL